VIDEHEIDERRWSSYMAAAHRGDSRLYELLLREVATAIERYVRRRFGTVPFVEDCVQECLLSIHLGRHTYDPRRPFRPWMFTIVHHRTVDFLRRSYVASKHAREDNESVEHAHRHAPDPADELAAGDWLRELEPLHRDALSLTKVAGYSTAEAAVRAGISEPAMRARVSRALRAAAQLFKREQNRR
jgi:RNA polymerase sigma-70 factor, ECF subfamily